MAGRDLMDPTTSAACGHCTTSSAVDMAQGHDESGDHEPVATRVTDGH